MDALDRLEQRGAVRGPRARRVNARVEAAAVGVARENVHQLFRVTDDPKTDPDPNHAIEHLTPAAEANQLAPGNMILRLKFD